MSTFVGIVAVIVAMVEIYLRIKGTKEKKSVIYLSKDAKPSYEERKDLVIDAFTTQRPAPTKPPPVGDSKKDKCPYCKATVTNSSCNGAISDKKYWCGTSIYKCGASEEVKRTSNCITWGNQ